MNGKEITDKLKEINQLDELICTDIELNEYIDCGLIIPMQDKYITRNGKILKIDTLKSPNYKFSLNFNSLIQLGEDIAKKEKINKIYFMTEKTFNQYMKKKLIINKSNVNYFRLFDNELWKVVII